MRAATAVVAVSLAFTPGLVAQVVGAVDVGVTGVRYDGFLPSTAGSVSPAFRLERPWALVSARGTYLRFESGRHSFQGHLAASLFTRSAGLLRGEVSGSVGASRYAAFASFSHVLLGPRVHLVGEREGAWVGGMAGKSSFGQSPRPVTAFSVGTWTERLAATWLVSTTVTHVGDTAYADIEGATHWQHGRVMLDGVFGVRGWSRGAGHGVYGEASATFAVSAWLAVVVSGGRYPTDPTRGSVSGRYLGATLRMTALPRRSTGPLFTPRVVPRWHSPANGSDPAPMTIEVHDCRCGGRGKTLLVRAGDASYVEVAGDFTDWESVSLSPGEASSWTVTLPLSPGTYRFNIRIDGGEWLVPAGLLRLIDEFGGEVGLLTVRERR
jgi:hypothetical protein